MKKELDILSKYLLLKFSTYHIKDVRCYFFLALPLVLVLMMLPEYSRGL